MKKANDKAHIYKFVLEKHYTITQLQGTACFYAWTPCCGGEDDIPRAAKSTLCLITRLCSKKMYTPITTHMIPKTHAKIFARGGRLWLMDEKAEFKRGKMLWIISQPEIHTEYTYPNFRQLPSLERTDISNSRNFVDLSARIQ